MKKRETKKVTPERLQQFGFAYAPPLIISEDQIGEIVDKVGQTIKAVA